MFTASLDVLDADDVEQNSSLPPVHPDYIQRGADVLALFQDMPRYRRFTQRWFDLSESSIVPQPVFRIWQDEMWNVHKDVLTAARPDELYALSETVWRNTRQPLELSGQMTYSDWGHAATGVNLRWEVIGIILALVGLVAVNLSDWDSIFDDIRDDIVDRSTFSERMRNASELALCFCYECEVLNDLYICFIYEGLCLIELLKGDSRKRQPTKWSGHQLTFHRLYCMAAQWRALRRNGGPGSTPGQLRESRYTLLPHTTT
jgi:hypothetical protein